MRRTRRRYERPKDQCLYARCNMKMVEKDPSDPNTLLGLCHMHMRKAVGFLNESRRTFYNA